MKDGSIVTWWPYGEPAPEYGIVIGTEGTSTHVMWMPNGNTSWIRTISLTEVAQRTCSPKEEKMKKILDKYLERDNNIIEQNNKDKK